MNYASLADDLAASAAPRSIASARDAHGLSDEQYAALLCPFDQSAVVTAGAGAGKTRLLVERAMALVRNGADPRSIAVVTFTRKAADEIATRMTTRFGSVSKVPVCATVHSLALSSLLAQGVRPEIADAPRLQVLAEKLRAELPEDWQDYTAAELLLEINRCREEQAYLSDTGLVANRFEEMLDAEGIVDFTRLLEVAARILAPRFKHILVDESQDLSALQRSVLQRLAEPRCRFWYIGDADQSIYAFRGAQADVMQGLLGQVDAHFVLSTNYRSTRTVVAHANNVIRFNPGRIPVDWTAHRTEQGQVEVLHFEHGDNELAHVREWLRTPGRMALARTQALVAALKAEGLPAMSVHESKGLEWTDVWVMGCEAACFPHPLGVREEERRLFYVAMTRARDTLTMSYCASRARRDDDPERSAKRDKGMRHPSSFLYETQALEKKS